MSGFECQFIEEPAQYLQTHCPICLLVLREPFQVTCCGKSFCRECITRVRASNELCPTCKDAGFDLFQNKGLQQPLYGFRVFCSNKESGCDWQGELRQLDQHLNLNRNEDKQSAGCKHAEVKCTFCRKPHPRHEIEHHQTSQCAERPFTCSLCEEYESTYTDVVTNHSPVCKCRPVECPNSCGTNNLQHRHLEEHVSTQCPLSYVECEFSDAGCDAKVYRKDLPSHLGENMVTHMSLLARENRKLKQQLRERDEKLRENACNTQDQSMELKEQEKEVKTEVIKNSVPPIDLFSNFAELQLGETWLSRPFYSRIGGYKLQLQVRLVTKVLASHPATQHYRVICKYNVLDSESALPRSRILYITTQIKKMDTIVSSKIQEVNCQRKNCDYVLFQCSTNSLGHKNVLHVSQINHQA